MSATVEILGPHGNRMGFEPGEVEHIVVGGARFSVDALLYLAMSSGQVFQAKREGDTVTVVLHAQRRQVGSIGNGHPKPTGG